MRGVPEGNATSVPPPTTPPTPANNHGGAVVESIEIDLVSDDEDDEVKISATVIRTPLPPPPPPPPPPLQDHRQQTQQQEQTNEKNTNKEGPAVRVVVAEQNKNNMDKVPSCESCRVHQLQQQPQTQQSTSSSSGDSENQEEEAVLVGSGALGSRVEWSRCLVCNKGFLAIVNPIEKPDMTKQLTYLLGNCMGVPGKKCRKTVKKILEEVQKGQSGQENQEVVSKSLFCPTHETMVEDASVLSANVTKLMDELDGKEEMLKGIVKTWIGEAENEDFQVGAAGLIVKNVVLKLAQSQSSKFITLSITKHNNTSLLNAYFIPVLFCF